MDHRATHLIHTRLEGDARARASLLEHHREGAVMQRAMWLVTLEFVFDNFCAFEHMQELVARKITELQEMPQRIRCSGVRHKALDRVVCQPPTWLRPF